MLYDTRWDHQTTETAPVKHDPLSLSFLIAWLETMPKNGEYSFLDCNGGCLLSLFMEAQGISWLDGKGHSTMEWRKLHYFPMFKVAVSVPHTFGAALTRARAIINPERTLP